MVSEALCVVVTGPLVVNGPSFLFPNPQDFSPSLLLLQRFDITTYINDDTTIPSTTNFQTFTSPPTPSCASQRKSSSFPFPHLDSLLLRPSAPPPLLKSLHRTLTPQSRLEGDLKDTGGRLHYDSHICKRVTLSIGLIGIVLPRVPRLSSACPFTTSH